MVNRWRHNKKKSLDIEFSFSARLPAGARRRRSLLLSLHHGDLAFSNPNITKAEAAAIREKSDRTAKRVRVTNVVYLREPDGISNDDGASQNGSSAKSAVPARTHTGVSAYRSETGRTHEASSCARPGWPLWNRLGRGLAPQTFSHDAHGVGVSMCSDVRRGSQETTTKPSYDPYRGAACTT